MNQSSFCPGNGPCDTWDLDLSCLDQAGGLEDACLNEIPVSAGTLINAELSASQVLWALTGRQFGVCTTTIRPCRRDDWPGLQLGSSWSGTWVYPEKFNGSWINICCGCQNSCTCGPICEINLPQPVCEVTKILIDGVELDNTGGTTWRIDEHRKLVRIDGGCWPICQDLSKQDTEIGTWSVELSFGKEIPQLVLDAAAELACEFLKARLGQQCKLPNRLASLSRQGVTMNFVDPQNFWNQGLTGIYLVDLAIRTFNPHGNKRRAGVYSVDSKHWRVPT